MELLVATGNPGKVREFRRILAPLGIRTLCPADLGIEFEAEETGATFAENAAIKATALYRQTGQCAVADDSGLCVDALGGRPGVHSARYHGQDTPYPEKIAALLGELRDVPDERRTARFVCSICCVLGEDMVLRCERSCEGRIGWEPSGSGGFGYDPIFYVGGTSFAALPDGQKDEVSHRGKALRELAAGLEEYLRYFNGTRGKL